MKYKPLRDLVLVKKIEETESAGGIILPEKKSIRWVRLEVLSVGPDVKEYISSGLIVLAEAMVEPVEKGSGIGLILSQYIVAIEYDEPRN